MDCTHPLALILLSPGLLLGLLPELVEALLRDGAAAWGGGRHVLELVRDLG